EIYSYYYYSPVVTGVYFYYGVDSFENSGTINASASVGDVSGEDAYAEIYSDDEDSPVVAGVSFYDDVGTFINSGSDTISASASIGDVSGDYAEAWIYSYYEGSPVATGVYFYYGVEDFENSGTISASASIGDVSGDYAEAWIYSDDYYSPAVAGVFFYDDVGSFENSGTISASASIGDVSGDYAEAWIYGYDESSPAVTGAYFYDDVGTFENSGTISASAQIGNASGYDSQVGVYGVSGVYFDYYVGTFTNSSPDTISASVVVGDASGTDASVELGDLFDGIYGVKFGDYLDSFNNSGTITASARAGNASGEEASIDISTVVAVVFNGSGSVTNRGNILTRVAVGDASGVDSSVSVDTIGGVVFMGDADSVVNYGNITTAVSAGSGSRLSHVSALTSCYGYADITNYGNIGTQITVGADSYVDHVYAVHLWGSYGSFTNYGNVFLYVDPTSAPVDHAAGIYVEDSEVTISNPGIIRLYSDISDANIRTLWMKDSYVTFQDKFGIVFGCPGITKRPIYLDDLGTTLDLNGASLIAYADRDLRINHPYYLIELSDPEVDTVEDVFDGLIDGTKNPDISPSWYGPARGEDAPEDVAVIWKYDPKHSTADLSIHASGVVARNVLGVVTSHLMYDKLQWWVSENDRPVKVADSGQIASEAGPGLGTLTGKEYKTGAFVYPVYTDVEADDLGYDAHVIGFTLGLERRITNAMTLGIFGGISKADVNFNDDDFSGIDDEQDIYHMGVFTNYACGPWYLAFTAMGYAVQHDYEGKTGPDLDMHETADYWSHGLESELVGGYAFGDHKTWMIMPEVGIGYSYWRVGDYKTDADYSNWDKEYDSEDDSYFRSIVGFTGLKRWFAKDTKIDLLASVRWEQALGDNDISITQSIPGIGSGDEDVEEDIGDTSIIGRVGLSVTIMDRAKLNLTFRSEFNEDYTV
ncbi:MAG: hypothetical protein DRI91_06285, partial [Aquificota bacterium]